MATGVSRSWCTRAQVTFARYCVSWPRGCVSKQETDVWNIPPCATSPKMRSALALVLGLATVGSLALNAQPHRTQLARRVRLSRPGLADVRMQNEEEIAELEAKLAGLKKAKVR